MDEGEGLIGGFHPAYIEYRLRRERQREAERLKTRRALATQKKLARLKSYVESEELKSDVESEEVCERMGGSDTTSVLCKGES
jgi:hypothetical protein